MLWSTILFSVLIMSQILIFSDFMTLWSFLCNICLSAADKMITAGQITYLFFLIFFYILSIWLAILWLCIQTKLNLLCLSRTLRRCVTLHSTPSLSVSTTSGQRPSNSIFLPRLQQEVSINFVCTLSEASHSSAAEGKAASLSVF